MVKVELIRAIAEKANVKNKDVEVVLDALHDVIVDTLKGDTDEKVPLGDLGSFRIKDVAERSGKSALDGKAWTKPAHQELVFKVSKALKDF